MEAAGLGTSAVGGAGAAGPAATAAPTGRLVKCSQVCGGGAGGGALSRRALGFSDHGRAGIPQQQQLRKVGLLQHLAAAVHHDTAAGRGGGGE